MTQITMRQHFDAPPERVFATLTDHVAFGRMLNADIRLETAGNPPPNGLGSVRSVNARGLKILERVVRYEPSAAMDYMVVSSPILKNHLGEMRFNAGANGGTDLDYRIRFDVPWYLGGGLLGGFIAGQLEKEITAGLGRAAQQIR